MPPEFVSKWDPRVAFRARGGPLAQPLPVPPNRFTSQTFGGPGPRPSRPGRVVESAADHVARRDAGAPLKAAPPVFALNVGRAMGTVVVTTHGLLNPDARRVLDGILRDLIENQGNLAVIVDLLDMSVSDPSCLEVFAKATASAAARGGRLTLADPSDALKRALRLMGLAGSIGLTGRRPSARITSGDGLSRGQAMADHPAGTGIVRPLPDKELRHDPT